MEQFPIIPPSRYHDDWHGVKLADFISERILELCYTAHDLQGFADDLGYTGPPFAWDEDKRQDKAKYGGRFRTRDLIPAGYLTPPQAATLSFRKERVGEKEKVRSA